MIKPHDIFMKLT